MAQDCRAGAAAQPEKKEALAALKRQYDRAYQQLRHLRKTGQLHAHALLTTQRLLREAWMILLDMPAPWQCDDKDIIALGNAQEGGNAHSSARELTDQGSYGPCCCRCTGASLYEYELLQLLFR